MRKVLTVLALAASTAAVAKDRATFLAGQYATKEQCAKLRAIEAGGPKNVGTSPELLTADGFKSWEGACEFTQIVEHEPGQTWVALMVCSEGMTMTPVTYVFAKHENEDGFDVHHADEQDGPEVYTRCDAKEGK